MEATMKNLSDDENRILDGQQGRLKQVALNNIVRYADILGAESLCSVTQATVFCGAHHYLDVCPSEDFDEVFSRMNMASDSILAFDTTDDNCCVQSCVSPCDHHAYKPFGQSEAFFKKNRYYLDRAKAAGVSIAGTCSPYLTGWLPLRGEHFVTTESGVTAIGNSIWGAMGNADGIEAAFWSAICGRTPRWGNHLQKNRAGTHLFQVEAPIQSTLEWDLLGKAIGAKLPTGSIPVITGAWSRVTFNKLRQMLTALTISSNCEMCHVVGYTPEARTIEDAFQRKKPLDSHVIENHDIQKAYVEVCEPAAGKIDFVSLGCPHYDLHQIKKLATYLEGKKIHPDVNLTIWTVYPIKAMADENGYTKIVEDAGGALHSGTCPASIGDDFLRRYDAFVFDSLKQAECIRSATGKKVYYGDARHCIDAAVSGKWEEPYRWKN
jgi:predicted aconitase